MEDEVVELLECRPVSVNRVPVGLFGYAAEVQPV
jgi:hypothetical protein